MNSLDTYYDIRPTIGSGDLVFFSGKGFLPWAIKKCTRSPWSHVGFIFRKNFSNTDDVILIAESTISKDDDGVQVHRLSDRIASADAAAMAICPLSSRIRSIMHVDRLSTIILQKEPNHYSKLGLTSFIWRQIPIIGLLPWFQRQDKDDEFCSDLVAEALSICGLPGMDPWKTKPQDLFELSIFETYIQLFGKPIDPERYHFNKK
jgi:hypothetical protein